MPGGGRKADTVPAVGHPAAMTPGADVRVRVRRAVRRTLALKVTPEGTVEARAPFWLPHAVIEEFIVSRRDWIARVRGQMQAQAARRRRATEAGAVWGLLGAALSLRVTLRAGARGRVTRDAAELHVTAPHADAVGALIERWYRRAAAAHYAARIAHFAPLVGRKPKRLRVTDTRSRWGSCSATGTVSLSWRLMQTTPAIVDYVVVHELCHLVHPNHSGQFWSEVARILPEHRAHRRALRAFAREHLV